MYVTCLDLEGVLVPEVWINVAKKTGIEKLNLTTRDIPDYNELMDIRLKVIEEHGLKLQDIQAVIATLTPFEGAREFLGWLKERCQVLILSDTFIEFAKPLMAQLDMPTIFCHSLSTHPDGQIANYHLRIDDPKRRAVRALRDLNFKTIAAGDSFNDTSMLEEAHQGIFFRPPAAIAAQFPQYPVVQDFEAFKAELNKHLPDPY
ncbi:MAG: bifunctional phosphoserine phosphatase/homoserine phosphotransferase ThrH [bacterium]|nr:bifunctional phosphoserine phosphatase/homoserine phosphotransferase ThrH [bacterium]